MAGGGSLSDREGFAYFRLFGDPMTLRSWFRLAIALLAVTAGQVVFYGPVELLLRASTTLALLGVVLGVLAFPAARMPAKRAELLAILGIVLATVPVAIALRPWTHSACCEASPRGVAPRASPLQPVGPIAGHRRR